MSHWAANTVENIDAWLRRTAIADARAGRVFNPPGWANRRQRAIYHRAYRAASGKSILKRR